MNSLQRTLWQLACVDVWRDKRISICMIAAVVSIVAPLLLLFGLKHGVVTQMRADLTSQPQNLELRMIGSHRLDTAWFDRAQAQASIGFVVPLTRALNTTGDLRVSAAAHIANAELIPTRAGDPLVSVRNQKDIGQQQTWLSAPAATRLQVSPGDTMTLIVTRQRQARTEVLRVPLEIAGVLAPAAFGRPAALIAPALLEAIERFRDDEPWPEPGIFEPDDDVPARELYPRARLYASDLDSVALAVQWLADQGIDVSSRLADVQAMQAVDRLLQLLFNVIAWLGIFGCTASLIGAFSANVDRKRRDLALLRLIGMPRRSLFGYVLVQALVLTAVGFAIGLGLYWVSSQAFDALLGQALADGQYVSLIQASHLGIAMLMALIVAVLVSLVAGFLAMQVQPSESLRDV